MGNAEHKISRQVMPQGGWKFQVGSIIIRGLDWIDLKKNVENHFKSNKIPVPFNIEQQIEDQILILQPNLRRKK